MLILNVDPEQNTEGSKYCSPFSYAYGEELCCRQNPNSNFTCCTQVGNNNNNDPDDSSCCCTKSDPSQVYTNK